MSFEAAEVPVAAVASPTAALPAGAIARALWATRVQFAVLGVLGGAWGAHIPSLKARYALGEAWLSMVLLAAAVGALLSLLGAGRIIGRLGARRTVMAGATVMGLLLAVVLLWPSLGWLLPAMVLFGMAMSLFDVAINTEGTAIESLGGRAVMGNLHGMFSVGAMAGAALSAALLRGGIEPATQLAAFGLACAGAALWAALAMLEAHPAGASAGPQAHFAWPRGVLLLIGLMIFAGMSAEGVMYDWSVLYLKQEVGLTQDMAAVGYAVFAGAMALSRFAGDALRERFAEHRILAGGAALTAVAMALVLISGQPGVSFVGYALVGAGLAPVVPILFNAATRVPGTSRAAAIAAVSSIGYAGFLVGPPLIGGIAQVASLTTAMFVIVVAAAALALGARRVG